MDKKAGIVSLAWGLCVFSVGLPALAQEGTAEGTEREALPQEEGARSDEAEPSDAAEPSGAAEPGDAADASDGSAKNDAPEQVSTASEESDGGNQGRFRWGISGVGGPYLGAYSGGAGGLDLRFGWQLNDKIGIYAQPQLALGFGAQADGNSTSLSVTALSGVGALVDYTVADMFYFGGGLGFSTGGFASGTGSSTSTETKVANGPFFDIPLRIGIAVGSKAPSRRRAFTIGINAHVLFVPSTVTSTADGGTVDQEFGLVILPLVALGYESF